MTLVEYIQWRQDQGDTLEQIRKDLLEDLDQGGPLFGEFRNFIKPTFPGSVSRFKNPEEEARITAAKKHKWSTTLAIKRADKKPICPDCLKLEGQVKSWKEWEEIGLPKKGKTQCGEGCRCVLLDVEPWKINNYQDWCNAGYKRPFRWKVTNTEAACEDCKKLDGMVKIEMEWGLEGGPHSRKRKTQCKRKCSCVLEPVYEDAQGNIKTFPQSVLDTAAQEWAAEKKRRADAQLKRAGVKPMEINL